MSRLGCATNDCPAARLPLHAATFRCPTCDGLLEVVHDEATLRAGRSASGWRDELRARLAGERAVDRSGVWMHREWVAPDVDEANVVTLGEGNAPLVHAARLGASLDVPELFVKQCGTSHTGSFKDLGMTVLVSVVHDAVRRGLAAPRALACASTGDTSAALAAYGAAAGLPVVVLLPRGKISTSQLLQPLAHGARVLALDTDFDGCMRLVAELARAGDVYLANSMNPLRLEGQKTVAFEIARQLGFRVPEWVVLPSGNLGNLSALAAGFELLERLGLTDRSPRLVAAQAERANPLVRALREGKGEVTPMAAGATLASAIRIGAPVSAPRALRALARTRGLAAEASETELAEAAAAADRAGLYACPHTGVALAVTAKLRAEGVLAREDRVVVISTAHGLKFTESKLGYHEGTLADVTPAHPNRPLELAAELGAVRAALAS